MVDCTIIGGGAAGLQAALVLGRARRETVLFDAGEQSNLPAHGIGGLLGFDGVPPAELYARGRAELARYPTVSVRAQRAGRLERDGEEFVVDGVRSRSVVLATGMDYAPPAIDGLAPLWGDTVVHCPFCHGWELRDRPLGLVNDDDVHAERLLPMLRCWSDDVIRITEPIARLEAEDGKLARVVLADGTAIPRGGLIVAPGYVQREPFADQLGLERGPMNTIKVDDWGATTVPGVFAAGDAANMPAIQTAIFSGARAGAGVVMRLAGVS